MSIRNLFVLLSLIVTAAGCGGEISATQSLADRSTAPESPAQNEDSSTDDETGTVNEGWGDLTLKFVYDGEPPVQEPITLTPNVEYCGRTPPLDESLIVNPENRGIANVVVMLYVKRGDDPPPIHESFADTAEATMELSHQRCAFVPHITFLRVGQTLLLRNTDEIAHTVMSHTSINPPFHPLLGPNDSSSISIGLPEVRPVSIKCGIHPWMSAWLVVKDHPYVGVSDENGKVVIENLPAGSFQFVIWHERNGNVTSAIQDETEVTWPQGKALFTITAEEENDQGTFSIAASVFEER